jgi:hypothetical protein
MSVMCYTSFIDCLHIFMENIPQYNSCQEIKYEIYFNTMGVLIYGGKQLLSAYEIPYDV